MRYCVNCGAMNDTDAKYCSGCGKKFDSAPEGEVSGKDYSTEQTRQADAGQNAPYGRQTTAQTSGPDQQFYGNPYDTQNSFQGQAITEGSYKGYSIASLILGIASIVFSFFIPILPLAAAIVGLVLGNKAKTYGDNGLAKAGRITSIVGIILIALMIVLAIIGVALLSSAMISNPDFYNNLEDFIDTYSRFGY